jgi:hypothetical protein
MATTGTGAAKASPLDVVRGFGVMLGGSLALAGAAAWSAGSAGRALARGTRPRPFALAGAAGAVAYILLVRPSLLNWGARPEERLKVLPGDELVEPSGVQTTRAVTIEAAVEEVWPWLAQVGQDRGGFYSYEWLENLAGCRMRNADRIHPEWQNREIGETVKLHWASGLKLARFEPNRVYGFQGWYFVIEPEGANTRLIARGRYSRGLASVAYALLLELPHFIMERKMLLGIKERAERRRVASDQAPHG